MVLGVGETVSLSLDIIPIAKDMGGGVYENRGVSPQDIIYSNLNVTALSINAGVVTVDLSLGDYFTLNLNANVTSLVFTNLPGSGRGFSKFIQITQTGAFTVDWPSSFRWEGGSADAVSGSAAVDLLAITSIDNGATLHATLSKDRKASS